MAGTRHWTTRRRKATRPSRISSEPAARKASSHPRDRMKSRMRLEKHPPMSFEVFGPVWPPDRVVLEIGKHRRALVLRASEVTVDIVHVDEQPVDDPWDRRPFARGRARLPVMLRALVLRCRGRQEDPAFPESELRVRDPPVAVLHPLVFAFMEPEGTDDQTDRRGGVLVRDHRHNRRHFLPLVLRHSFPQPAKVDEDTYLLPGGDRTHSRSFRPAGSSDSLQHVRDPADGFDNRLAGGRIRQTEVALPGVAERAPRGHRNVRLL